MAAQQMLLEGNVSGGGTGFLPAGHWIAAKQAMIQIYPRPDTETNTWARHRWAYYDGVNAVQYKIPLGVSFGAFPYVFTLQSGPSGMTIGATFWNTNWTSFQQALAAGYGYLLWTPTGSVSGATVSVLVTDQQMNTLTITFTVSTSSSTTQFIFVDAVHGNDSTGTGTISAPWATYSKAFTGHASALCYFRSGTYTLPVTGTISACPISEILTNSQPSALMGFPGDTAPIFTMTNCQLATNTQGADIFVQGLNPNGFAPSGTSNQSRLFWLLGSGNQSARQTFDTNVWSNSGYGNGSNNDTGYFFDGNSTSLTPYQFVNNCSETNRQSGFPGNNYGGCSFYGAINALVQGCSIIQSGLNMDGAYYFKSDVKNGCLRGNTVNVGSGSYTHMCSLGQELNNDSFNTETCYNTAVGSAQGIFLGFGAYPFGLLWCYRNSVIGNHGIATNGTAGSGPYVFDSNAAQGGSLPSGSDVQTDGLNIVQASGLLDTTTGLLTPAFASSVGKIGAQIA